MANQLVDSSLECGDAGKASQSCGLPPLINAVFSIRQIYYLDFLEPESVLARDPRLDIFFEPLVSTILHKVFAIQVASRFWDFEIRTDKDFRQALLI